MKVVNKVTVELTSDEYETLITAKQIFHEISDTLDENYACDDETGRYFDMINEAYESILNLIENGVEVTNGEDDN